MRGKDKGIARAFPNGKWLVLASVSIIGGTAVPIPITLPIPSARGRIQRNKARGGGDRGASSAPGEETPSCSRGSRYTAIYPVASNSTTRQIVCGVSS